MAGNNTDDLTARVLERLAAVRDEADYLTGHLSPDTLGTLEVALVRATDAVRVLRTHLLTTDKG